MKTSHSSQKKIEKRTERKQGKMDANCLLPPSLWQSKPQHQKSPPHPGDATAAVAADGTDLISSLLTQSSSWWHEQQQSLWPTTSTTTTTTTTTTTQNKEENEEENKESRSSGRSTPKSTSRFSSSSSAAAAQPVFIRNGTSATSRGGTTREFNPKGNIKINNNTDSPNNNTATGTNLVSTTSDTTNPPSSPPRAQSPLEPMEMVTEIEPNQEIVLLGEIVGASGLILKQSQQQQHDLASTTTTTTTTTTATTTTSSANKRYARNTNHTGGHDNDDEEDPHGNMTPFATVQLGTTRWIHQTQPCTKERGRNPLWTPLTTQSLFLLSTTPAELAREQYVYITLWTAHIATNTTTTLTKRTHENNNNNSSLECLGKTRLHVTTLLSNCQEQRILRLDLVDEFTSLPSWSTSLLSTSPLPLLGGPLYPTRGLVAVRFRHATPSDQVLISTLNQHYPKASHGSTLKNSSCNVGSPLPPSPPPPPPVHPTLTPSEVWTLLNQSPTTSTTTTTATGPTETEPNTNDWNGQGQEAHCFAPLVTELDGFEMAEAFVAGGGPGHHECCADSGASTSSLSLLPSTCASSPNSLMNVLSSAFVPNSIRDEGSGEINYRIKPYPDPQRPTTTAFLSKAKIQEETHKPSTHWIHAGSGRYTLGQLYLEILSCHDLPNLDAIAGQAVGGNVTDAFVAAVFEDVMVQTDAIDDELSPHWLPWMKRAFVFGILHPASMLYLGCFDYDYAGPLIESGHDAIGRVAVNIANLQRNTDYTLHYNLHTSSNVTERKAIYGTITIRLRIEMKDEKEAVLAAIRNPIPNFHVNVRKEQSQDVLLYTCFGQYGDERDSTRFDLTVTRSYLNELLEYKMYLGFVLGDAIHSLLYWKGQVPCLGLRLPLHSFLLFCSAATLVERPQMFPAFLLLSVAWILWASSAQRQEHPSPWFRGPTIWDFLRILRTGQAPPLLSSSVSSSTCSQEQQQCRIQPWERNPETEAYDRYWQERVDRRNEDLDAAVKRAAIIKHLKNKEASSDELDENQSTPVPSSMAERLIPVEWLVRLGLWQGKIGVYCRNFRLLKIIFTWEESIVSFWIMVCFLAAGLVALLMPWGLIFTMLGRCIVWVFMGPHMMVVDAYFTQQQASQSSTQSSEKWDSCRRKPVVHTAIDQFNQEHKRELPEFQQAAKQREIKALLFGHYGTRVPIFNLSRHYDRPLPMSYASPSLKERDDNKNHSSTTDESIRTSHQIVRGQQLFGVMIPRFEEGAVAFDNDRAALKAKAIATKACMDQIESGKVSSSSQRDNEGNSVKGTRRSARRESVLPSELGYEVIPLGLDDYTDSSQQDSDENLAPPNMFRTTPVSVDSSSSLEVDEDAHVAVLAFDRRDSSSSTSYRTSTRRGSRGQSQVRSGYEMIHYDPITVKEEDEEVEEFVDAEEWGHEIPIQHSQVATTRATSSLEPPTTTTNHWNHHDNKNRN